MTRSRFRSRFCYLVQRQVGYGLHRQYQCAESIKSLKHSDDYDLMEKEHIVSHFKLSSAQDQTSHFLLSRKIKDLICITDEYVIAISEGGCAMYYHLEHKGTFGFLNRDRNEFISNVFWNTTNDTLCINYCVFDNPIVRRRLWKDRNRLFSRVLPFRYLKQQELHRWFPIFESENLRHPGFLEFDSVNQVILTYSAPLNRYRLWKMQSYELLMTFDKEWMLKELRLSPGALLLIDDRCLDFNYIQLRTFCFKHGRMSEKLRCPVQSSQPVDFVELLGNQFAIKQPQNALQMYNMKTQKSISIKETSTLSSQHFIFLYQKQFILMMQDFQIVISDFSGETISRINHSFLFEDPTQYSPASIYLPKEQDLLIIYDKYATVRIVDLVEGKCLTQLDLRTKLSKQPESNAFIPETEKLVMFAYNSLRQELYTINKRAHMRKWSC